METTIAVLRIIHIMAGAVALATGVVPLAVKKGSRVHKQWGKIYIGAMSFVLSTALLLSLFKSIPFLLLVSVFSSYLVLSGYRSVRTKTPLGRRSLPDVLLGGAGILGGVLMAGYGINTILHGNIFGIVAVVFGVLCIVLAALDIKRLRGHSTETLGWLYSHIARTTGAYISTITAFLVVNVHFLPGWLVWLLPTAIGSLLIIRWTAAYKPKRAPRAGAAETSSE